MARVIVIGIDGLDADLLRVYGPSLPHLRRLMLESPYLELQSCFPPDPASAWASIYSGQPPAQHGILPQLPIQGTAHTKEQPPDILPAIPEGATFWDSASKAGKHVCVINPFNIYPSWRVNGVMLTLPMTKDTGCGVSITASEAITVEQFPSMFDVPAPASPRQLGLYCQALRDITEQQTTIALELLRGSPWDLFFIQYDALDLVQHLCWRYSDPGDPMYPGNNEHAGRIRDCYALFDQVIGRFQTEMENDCVLLVVSGYGHGRGSATTLNLNEWLRQEGLLVAKKHSPLRWGFRADAQLRFLRRQPRMARALTERHTLSAAASSGIDEERTQARVVMLSSARNIGGIALNRDAIRAECGDYEAVRQIIIQRLLHLRLHGCPVAQQVKRREDLYDGPNQAYLDHYPDIIFELRGDYALSNAVQLPLTTESNARHVVSGTHRTQGVLLIGNLPGNIAASEIPGEPQVTHIAPTVLSLLAVDATANAGDALVVPTQPSLPQKLRH